LIKGTNLPTLASSLGISGIKELNDHSFGTIFEALLGISFDSNKIKQLEILKSVVLRYVKWVDLYGSTDSPQIQDSGANDRCAKLIESFKEIAIQELEKKLRAGFEKQKLVQVRYNMQVFDEGDFEDLSEERRKILLEVLGRSKTRTYHPGILVAVKWYSRSLSLWEDYYYNCCGQREGFECSMDGSKSAHSGALYINEDASSTSIKRNGGGGVAERCLAQYSHIPVGRTPTWKCCGVISTDFCTIANF
jgi:hypothetical protein